MPPSRSRLWRLSLGAFALVVLLAVLERFVAERWWVTTLLTYAPQQPVAALPALLLAVSLTRRQWRAALPNAAALLLACWLLLGVHVPLSRAPRGEGPPLRVLTYNLELFVRGKPEQFRELAEREHADIVCFQEARAVGSRETSPALLRAFAGWHQAAKGELAIFSRDPIVRQQVHQLADTARPLLEVTLDHRGRPVTLMNVHFSVALLPETLASHRGSLPDYLRRTATVREHQAVSLLDLVARTHGPVLVVGDLNTPPRGLVYRRLAAELEDGFAARGWGMGNTYSARRPLLRIDYVFAAKGTRVSACRVLPERRLSDHRPALADVVL